MLISRGQDWRPSKGIKIKDHILSSDYLRNIHRSKNMPKEISSKEKVNMFELLSMEYSRRWFRQLEESDVVTLLRPEDSGYLMRRYVIRGLTAKKLKRKEPLFKMKKFENVPARINSFRKPLIEILMKGMEEKENNAILEEVRNEISRKQKGKICEKAVRK